MFVQVANIGYQRSFARLLRQILSKKVDSAAAGHEMDVDLSSATKGVDEDFPPELLQYRWIAGYNGLWCEDMGVPKEANKRQLSLDQASYE
jgi:hypothetical protein